MKIFVYGTLRNKYTGGMAEYLRNNAVFLGEGKVYGNIYYSGFPCAKLGNSEKDGFIHGDVYEVTDTDVLRTLDSYEGYPTLYNREEVKLVALSTEDFYIGGDVESVWIYTYNGSVTNMPHIDNGDYLGYIANKRGSKRVSI